MGLLQNQSSALVNSFTSLWMGVVAILPSIVIAIVIFIAGWIFGTVLGRLVSQLFRTLKVDHALRQAGVEEIMHRAGYPLNSGKLVGNLVKWFVIAAFLIASFDVLHLDRVTLFLQNIVFNFLPQVIVAVLILLVAGIVADFISNLVTASAGAAGLRSARMLGTISKWTIWIFAFVVALSQVGIATAYLQTLFTGVVVALSLALGLSFGLGGQDAAARTIEKIGEEVSMRNRN
jgi:hypothetical protein